MVWQDIAISIASWLAIAALVPSVVGPHKPALSSSLITAACVATFGISYFTLGLLASAASSALLFLLWTVLAWQKWRDGRVQ